MINDAALRKCDCAVVRISVRMLRLEPQDTRGAHMSSVARVTEIIASSKKSFDDALENGVKRATKTLKNVAGAWVASQDVVVAKGKITEYRVRLKVTFVLAE
jgi:flavin-binding protein dodecin